MRIIVGELDINNFPFRMEFDAYPNHVAWEYLDHVGYFIAYKLVHNESIHFEYRSKSLDHYKKSTFVAWNRFYYEL